MILKYLELIFTCTYLHYDHASKTESEPKFEESIAEGVEKRRQKSVEQERKGLQILTPNQMLIRLPISLAQWKAGNNSEKLKNETGQLLYSLYR